VTIFRKKEIACFVIGGELRLCLPQVLSELLPNCPIENVHSEFENLQINCNVCSEEQMRALKRHHILPDFTSTATLITRSDAERVLILLAKRDDWGSVDWKQISPLPQDEGFLVAHGCFCEETIGRFYPELYKSPVSPCILCINPSCKRFFNPLSFCHHYHHAQERTVCHWGLQLNEWRAYIRAPYDITYKELKSISEGLEKMKEKFPRKKTPSYQFYKSVTKVSDDVSRQSKDSLLTYTSIASNFPHLNQNLQSFYGSNIYMNPNSQSAFKPWSESTQLRLPNTGNLYNLTETIFDPTRPLSKSHYGSYVPLRIPPVNQLTMQINQSASSHHFSENRNLYSSMAVALVAAAASQNQAVTRFNNQVSTPDPRYHLVSDLGRDQPQISSTSGNQEQSLKQATKRPFQEMASQSPVTTNERLRKVVLECGENKLSSVQVVPMNGSNNLWQIFSNHSTKNFELDSKMSRHLEELCSVVSKILQQSDDFDSWGLSLIEEAATKMSSYQIEKPKDLRLNKNIPLKKRHKNKDNFGGAKVPQFPGREKESENQRLFEEMKMLKAENEKLKNMLKKNQFENDFSLDSHLHLTSNRLAKVNSLFEALMTSFDFKTDVSLSKVLIIL